MRNTITCHYLNGSLTKCISGTANKGASYNPGHLREDGIILLSFYNRLGESLNKTPLGQACRPLALRTDGKPADTAIPL